MLVSYYNITAALSYVPVLLRCRSAVAPLSLRCRSDVAPMLLRCRFAVNPLSLCWRCCFSFCRSDVAPAVAPLLLLLSLHCRSTAASVATLSHLKSLMLSLHCHSCCRSAISPLSVRCPSVVAPLLLLSLLLSLGLFTVVASRGRIRVTVDIGDCQARVSSYL